MSEQSGGNVPPKADNEYTTSTSYMEIDPDNIMEMANRFLRKYFANGTGVHSLFPKRNEKDKTDE